MDPAVNRQYILKSRPVGLPTPEDVPMLESPVPEAGPGQIVIRNLYMSLDPAIRGWMSDEPNYIEPIPVGTPVWAGTIGRVVQSNSPDFEVGDIATGLNTWEDYSVCDAEVATKVDPMGMPLATDVLSGERADDGLYIPIIKRIEAALNRCGLLFVGDCKMSKGVIKGSSIIF